MKRIMFLPVLLMGVDLCSAANVQDNEVKLLNEMVADELKKSGTDCPFSFRGTLNFTALSVDQDEKGDNKNGVFALEGDIFLKYLNKYDRYSYGAEVGMKANSGIMKQGSPILRTAHLFAESETAGALKIGFIPTTADSMTVNGGSVLVGYGGAASRNLSLFYNESAGSFVDMCFPFDDNKAAKVAYSSPSFSGFSFGISFTPDSRSANPFKTLHPKPQNPEISLEKANFPGMRSAYSTNIVTGGVTYDFGDPKALNGKISLCGWVGKGNTSVPGIRVHDVRAWNVGATVGYGDFKLALGYADNGKSLRSKRHATADIATFDKERNYTFSDPEVGLKPGADTGKMYSVGLSYAVNTKLAISAGYFTSKVKFSDSEKSVADVITLAGEYTFDKRASVYVEYDRIKSDSCARAQAYGKACGISSTGKNKGNIFMIGTKINI
ncbi:MAG: porin [Holosporaceae bacterium]|nr:porin [Holosporaceae bacterium]